MTERCPPRALVSVTRTSPSNVRRLGRQHLETSSRASLPRRSRRGSWKATRVGHPPVMSCNTLTFIRACLVFCLAPCAILAATVN